MVIKAKLAAVNSSTTKTDKIFIREKMVIFRVQKNVWGCKEKSPQFLYGKKHGPNNPSDIII